MQVTGKGLVREDRTKTQAGIRTLALPTFAVNILLRRQVQEPANEVDAVFATRNGTWVSAHNVRRQWRAVRADAGLE